MSYRSLAADAGYRFSDTLCASEIFRALTIPGSAAILAACFNNENAGSMPALPGFAKNLRCARHALSQKKLLAPALAAAIF